MGRCREYIHPIAALILAVFYFQGSDAAVLAGADITGDTDGYFFLTDTGGCAAPTCCAQITVTTTGGGQFTVNKDGTDIINTAVTSPTSTVDMACTISELSSPGMYTVTMTVTDSGDSFSKTMVAVYEETLVGYSATASHLYAPPFTLVTFDMIVDSGTNALFTVDCITNIQLMKSCDGNARNATYSQFFNATGSYPITTMVSNYGSKLSEVIVVNIIHNMNEVTVTMTDNKPEGNGDPGIKVNMGSGVQEPMGNLSSWYTCSDTDTQQILALTTLAPGGDVAVPCTCTGQQNFTVTVNVSTELDSLQEIFDVYCWDLLNISISLEKDVQPINDEVPFIIENLPTYGFQYSINACQGNTIEDTNAGNYGDLYTAMTAIDLSAIRYTDIGNCTLHATFWNEMYIVVMDLFFELSIGINDLTAVPSDVELLAGETFTLVVNASGIDIFWSVDFEEAMVVQSGCEGLVAEHNFTEAKIFTIDVMASNRVNNKSLSLTVAVVYPINGFTVTTTSHLIQSHEDFPIAIALDAAANINQPMSTGNLSLYITPCGTEDVSTFLPETEGATENFNCNFTVQGNYTVNVTISSSKSEESFPLELTVCDTLTTTISVTKFEWGVGESIDVTLNNLPLSGFNYNLDMADGSTVHADANAATLEALNTFTTVPSISYASPGVYNITLDASNNCYATQSIASVGIFYPIPACDLVITPVKTTYISPDHTVSFAFVTSDGNPTNNPNDVTCDFNYGDGTPITGEATAFDFTTSTGLTKTHDYTTEGLLTYIIHCENLVSDLDFTATIDVVTVEATDFTITYLPVTALSGGVCADFVVNIDFHGLTDIPANVEYTIDYDDGNGPSALTPLTSYTITKSLCTRGAFVGDITFHYGGSSNPNPINYALGTSTMVLTNPSVDINGLVGTTSFDFTVKNNLAEAINLVVDWKDGPTETVSLTAGQTTTVTHAFATHGYKIPNYSATGTSVGDDNADLDAELYIMYPVADLELEVVEPILLGIPIEPTIHYRGSNFLMNLTCQLTYNADDSETMTEVNVDSTNNVAIALGYSYMEIQEETVIVVCSNPLTQMTMNQTFEVSSDCFKSPELFESLHRRINTPFRAYMSGLPILTGNVQLTEKCMNTTEFNFQWTFKKRVIGTVDQFDDYAMATPNKISINLATSTIEEGFYYVELYMYLVERPGDYLRTYQYMQLVNPPLVCTISGGDFTAMGLSDILVLDASTNSYDPMVGVMRPIEDYGAEPLEYSWACYVAPDCATAETYTLPGSTDKSYESYPTCSVSFPNQGFIEVDMSSLAPDTCYIIEQTISRDNRNATDLQIVQLLTVPPCQVAITCWKNCAKKITPEQPTSFEVNIVCEGEPQSVVDAATNEWFFYKFNPTTNALEEQVFGAGFLKEKTSRLFELDPNVIEAGASVRLEVRAVAGSRPEGKAYMDLNGNLAPRGGLCEVTPDEVTFLNGSFSLLCDNMKDEGIRKDPDNVLDLSEPLKLRIKQDGTLLREVDFTRKVSISHLDMSVGLEANGYVTNVELEVTDSYGGVLLFSKDVIHRESRPALPDFGTSADTSNKTAADIEAEQEQFIDFLTSMNETVSLTEGLGDPLRTVATIGAISESINSISIPIVSIDDVGQVSGANVEEDMARSLEAGTTVNPYVEEIQSLTENFANTLRDTIANDIASFEESGRPPSVTTLTLYINGVSKVSANPAFSTPKSTGFVGQSLLMLSDQLMNARNNTLDIRQAEEMKSAVAGLLESVVNLNFDYGVTGVEVEGEDELANLTGSSVEATGGYNDLEADYLKSLLKRREELRLKAAQESLNSNAAAIQKALSNLFVLANSLITDNSTTTIEKPSTIQMVEKIPASQVLNNSKEVNGSSFDIEGIEGGDGDDDIIEKNFGLLNNNPFVTGSNAKLAEHAVSVGSVTKNGQKLQLKNVGMSRKDPFPAEFKRYEPSYTPDDPGMMFYHRFPYRSLTEQICITATPEDLRVCYDICLRSIIAPTDLEADFCIRNVTGQIGREYCADAQSCKRRGICWLALVPFPCDIGMPDPPAHRRVKRSVTTPAPFLATSNNTDANSTNMMLTPYWLRIITMSCLSWSGQEQDWKADECTVTRDGVNNRTKCTCGDKDEMITTVSFFVAPNAIDFSTVFSKFDIAGQGAVLGTILCVFVLFVIALFWARYKDGQDVLQWGVTLLADNYQQDEYFYLVTVHTGMVRHGGTTSKIGFCIAGEEDDSGVRILSDGVREEMKTGSTMHFLMAVPNTLGVLQCFRIWHDSSGKGDNASWYLNRIEVTDLQTSDKYDFLCYKWMALEEGVLDRALPLSSVENMKNFKTMFFEHARHHITDDHLWVSVVLRPVKSHFSRVQRVGCCYVLLMLAMISNAMFFQSKDNKTRQQGGGDFTIGPISFSLSQIYISFVSCIITAVPVFFVMLLFRKSKLSDKVTKDGARLWMPSCFRNFKFYKQSKAVEKIMVVRDIVDDVDGVLPHFCVYISWVFSFICVFVSAFFIMLYSMEWGKDISEEWLVTFILSFFESLIILDPVKVFVLAVLFAILLKTLKASRPSNFNLPHIKRMVRELGMVGEGRARMDYRSPFSEEELLAAKNKCRKKNTLKKAIQELLTNSFLLILLCSISYSNRDVHGYRMHENIANTFMNPFRPAVTLEHVNTTSHYFRWLNETVIPNMFPQTYYDGSLLEPNMRLRISDLASYKVGPPRLRQVRQAEVPCNIPYIGNTACFPVYDVATEDTGTWCRSWRSKAPCPDEQALDVTNQAWTYVTAAEIWGLPITGQLNVYGGGGYIANLDISNQVAMMTYDELYKYRWIDRRTRAVFLEFTLYNANKNMFCYVSILAEFPESGGVHEFTNVYPFRSFNHLGSVGKYILMCEILFFIFSLGFMGYIFFKIAKDRFFFFKSFWNVVELVSVLTSFGAIVLYFLRLSYTNDAMALFRENDRQFVNFYHIAMWDSLFVYTLAFLVGLATLRLLKVMGYSRVTQMVYLVLKESAKTLPGFFFFIMLILAAYGLLGYIIFGKTSLAYKDPITTMETLFSAVLGHAGFRNTNIPASDSWMTLIYFVSFIMIVVFALSNIFMTILLDTLSTVEDDPETRNYKEIELFAYMFESAKMFITGRKDPRGVEASKGDTDDGKDGPPFTVGGFAFGGFEGHAKKMQMKMNIVNAMKGNEKKPTY